MRAAVRETAIRAAALRIFRRKGYHAASMQEIADAVGLPWVHRWYRPRGRLTETAIADDYAERAVRMLSP